MTQHWCDPLAHATCLWNSCTRLLFGVSQLGTIVVAHALGDPSGASPAMAAAVLASMCDGRLECEG